MSYPRKNHNASPRSRSDEYPVVRQETLAFRDDHALSTSTWGTGGPTDRSTTYDLSPAGWAEKVTGWSGAPFPQHLHIRARRERLGDDSRQGRNRSDDLSPGRHTLTLWEPSKDT